MSSRFRLVSMKNTELLAGLSQLVERSNELTGDLLAHLAELEERMLHLTLGFSSSFAYCVEALGMSEGAAGRRVTAARVCRRFPEAFELVARGDLHLSALCGLSAHLNPENAAELFGACRRKTRRQVEELLAARFPKPDVREQIRRLPGRAQLPEREQTQAEALAQPSDTKQREEAAVANASEIREIVVSIRPDRPKPELPHLRVVVRSKRSPSIASAHPTAPARHRSYVVRAGDNLWAIAKNEVARRGGETATDGQIARYWQHVVAANRGTLRSGDPSLIFPGEVVALPLD